jgi:predicted nucleotide-binding protein
VRITEDGRKGDEVKNDLDQEALERQFLVPYRHANAITINGKVIPADRIERIKVSVSDEISEEIIARLRNDDRMSGAFTSGTPSLAWRVADQAADVTDQFITGPPGGEVPANSDTFQPSSARSAPIGPGDKRSVFVVSGRDGEAAAALVQLLRAVGLSIIEWDHAVNKVGVPNPYVGDVVFTGLQMADAAVVVLTPDDLVQLRPDLLHADDGDVERAVQGQGRPNVFYEAGIADAYSRQRTVIVEVGSVKSFSDISGRLIVRYDGSPSRRNALVERLRIAGLEPNTSGTDWLSVGDVAPSIDKARHVVISAQENNERLNRTK